MKLLLSNPVVQEDLNITVRRGNEWSGYRGPVGIAKHQADPPTHVANVVYTMRVERFKDLVQGGENQLLRLMHDPNCQTYEGLLATMSKAYGSDFNVLDSVTVVFFTISALAK